MSISVPIKPKDKFGIPRSQPEFESSARLAAKDFPSELAFLRELEVQGRLIHETGDAANLDVTPATGSTFFFHSANYTNPTVNAGTGGLVNDGLVIESVDIPAGTVTNLITKMASLVGDGVKTFRLNGAANIRSAMFGWIENTPKP